MISDGLSIPIRATNKLNYLNLHSYYEWLDPLRCAYIVHI